jgi:hypothetical protein
MNCHSGRNEVVSRNPVVNNGYYKGGVFTAEVGEERRERLHSGGRHSCHKSDVFSPLRKMRTLKKAEKI